MGVFVDIRNLPMVCSSDCRLACSWDVTLLVFAWVSITCESGLVISTVLRVGRRGDVHCWQVLLSSVLSFWIVWGVILGVIASIVDGLLVKDRRWTLIASFTLIVALTLRILVAVKPEQHSLLHGPGWEPLPVGWERLLSAVGAVASLAAFVGYVFRYKCFDVGFDARDAGVDGADARPFNALILLSITFELLGLICFCDSASRMDSVLPSLVYSLIATLYGSVMVAGLAIGRSTIATIVLCFTIVALNAISLLYLPNRTDHFLLTVLFAACGVSILTAGCYRWYFLDLGGR